MAHFNAPGLRRVLIANRGEIAVRIARAARMLGISPLGIASEADATAVHRSAMDESLIIGPPRASESYLNIERVIRAAQALRADAVHPGYGFLSERTDFAQAVLDAGLIYIGPSPETLALAGDKRQARRIAHGLRIPTLEGYDGDELDDDTLLDKARELGFPVLIKASNGGGGRGQRVVTSAAEFQDCLAQARREAKAAFGDDGILLERYIRHPRHIEMQIAADAYGTVVCIGERDCSLQRRRQKVVEEAPAPNLDPAIRAAMAEAAVSLARATRYRNVGTVEFLLDETGHWYFLEINARLQVEHPVTELVHDIDLVATQFRIAAGEALGITAGPARGWAVEARICAEDPAHDLLPSSGTITRLDFPEGEYIRVDSGIAAGSIVPIDYDSLLAKLCVWADTREAAFTALDDALRRTVIEGVATNLPVLRAIASDTCVREGRMHTTYLDESGLLQTSAATPLARAAQSLLAERAHARVASVGIPLFFTLSERRIALRATRKGMKWECTPLDLPGIESETFEAFHCDISDVSALDITGLEIRLASPLRWSAIHAVGAVQTSAGYIHVTAPMPGRILKLSAQNGMQVDERDLVAVLEAMKMEHRIEAGLSGTVTQVYVQEGDVIAAGARICDITKADS
jgi:3-methylcrotonyl-CoA carboxylase alpha subunit